MSRGEFITLEGIEGVGKTTAVKCVVEVMEKLGRTVVATREPGGTALGEKIRNLALDQHGSPITPETELLLMFAARAQHLEEVIRPALARGECVVCDRFTDATYAYQGGGRGVPETSIKQTESLVHGDLQPDTTLLLDVLPEIGLQRPRSRSTSDRIEGEALSFFERVRAAYRERAVRFPERTVMIDASADLKSVHAAIRKALKERYS